MAEYPEGQKKKLWDLLLNCASAINFLSLCPCLPIVHLIIEERLKTSWWWKKTFKAHGTGMGVNLVLHNTQILDMT